MHSLALVCKHLVLFKFGFLRYGQKQGFQILLCLFSYCIHYSLLSTSPSTANNFGCDCKKAVVCPEDWFKIYSDELVEISVCTYPRIIFNLNIMMLFTRNGSFVFSFVFFLLRPESSILSLSYCRKRTLILWEFKRLFSRIIIVILCSYRMFHAGHIRNLHGVQYIP